MLRVAALELPARFGEPRRALDDADALLARAGAIDLALMPEASITGYVSPSLDADLRRFAEPAFGPTARALADLARAHRVHLAGPLIERHDGGFANATLLFAPDGALLARYRKRHPWYVETWATPGDEPPPVVSIAGARVTFATCFDVHFVADECARELGDADVLLFPSAWVERKDSRAEVLGALARAFDVAIVNANWGRGEPRLLGQGGSMILDRRGAIVARADRAQAIIATI